MIPDDEIGLFDQLRDAMIADHQRKALGLAQPFTVALGHHSPRDFLPRPR